MTTPIRETIARAILYDLDEHSAAYVGFDADKMDEARVDGDCDFLSAADAVLRALDEAGCVVVPKEPTEAMRLAAVEAMGEQERAVRTRAGPADTSFKRGIDSGAIMACNSVNTDAAYRAMISASVVE